MLRGRVRTALAGKALAAWRSELLDDLGVTENVSTGRYLIEDGNNPLRLLAPEGDAAKREVG